MEQFDHLVVCCGVNGEPCLPPMPNKERFAGRILHSAWLKNVDMCKGKRVLLIGLGESGSDLTLQVARIAQSSCVLTRSGPGYIIPRYFGGTVADLDTSRIHHCLPRWFGGTRILKLKNWIEDRYLGDTDDVAVLAQASLLNRARGLPWQRRFGTKNTGFVEAMVHHKTLYKCGEVVDVDVDAVTFTDGSRFECDIIICCTGFRPAFPFLEPQLAQKLTNVRHLYKHLFHPDVGPSISLIGFVRPGVGSIPPAAEMQARYMAMLIAGKAQALPREQQWDVIRRDAERDMQQFPVDAKRVCALTDYLTYLDDMATLIGCQPPLRRLFFTQPRTWYKVVCGPLQVSQYRFAGPGAMAQHAAAVMQRVPTMPLPVVAYELLWGVLCKLLAALGLSSFQTIGF